MSISFFETDKKYESEILYIKNSGNNLIEKQIAEVNSVIKADMVKLNKEVDLLIALIKFMELDHNQIDKIIEIVDNSLKNPNLSEDNKTNLQSLKSRLTNPGITSGQIINMRKKLKNDVIAEPIQYNNTI